MAFDTGNYIIIGGSGSNRSNDVWIHERENNNGRPGKVLTMADAKGDVKEIAKTYIDRGFDPNKIIIKLKNKKPYGFLSYFKNYDK